MHNFAINQLRRLQFKVSSKIAANFNRIEQLARDSDSRERTSGAKSLANLKPLELR
jgi:hypothetical protein